MDDKKRRTFDFTKLKKENFVVIFLIGILLLVIAWPMEEKKEENEENVSGLTDMGSSIIGVSKEETYVSEGGTNLQYNDVAETYARSLEQNLEELLSTMEGAGKVKVMITLQSSGESVVEKDAGSSKVSSTEVDSSGGSRNTADVSATEETVYTGSSGTGTPFVKQIIYPQIEGVVVSAEGGGNDTVNKNITEAIQALFGIDVHKIKVIRMSSK
ncbi:MAG: stage III sporulation protein AG [Suilimivivens sp.]